MKKYFLPLCLGFFGCKEQTSEVKSAPTTTATQADSTAETINTEHKDPLENLPKVNGFSLTLPAVSPTGKTVAAYDVALYDNDNYNRCIQKDDNSSYKPGIKVTCADGLPASTYTLEITYYDSNYEIIGNFDAKNFKIETNKKSYPDIVLDLTDFYGDLNSLYPNSKQIKTTASFP